jgi:subtilisin family serine protease
VIAGIDWITAHHPEGAPAVANLSLGGDASSSIDTAVRNSIADGVTYVAAAGNSSVDACTASPGRVPEVLTVAATTSSDVRASYSNFGSCVDLFAPGSGVTSTYHSSDTATATMSGTSMASPHVAGIAALYLAAAPGSTPATVHAATVNGATPNVVTDVAGSANRLAFSRLATPPTLPTTGTPPATPGAPTATAASKAVSVSWSPPGDGGTPLTGYTVRVHKANGGKVVKTVAVDATTTNVSVGGLRAGVSFYATLQATNAVGSSAWSPASRTVVALR